MLEEMRSRDGGRVRVQDQIDIALPVKGHVLGTMLSGTAETQIPDQFAQGAA
jgi:hypothetical protein